MKKILIILTTLLLTLTNVYAANHALNHANPMPNLVRYAMGNAELIGLTKVQKKEIKSWASINKPKMMKLVKQVRIEERKLLEESLTTDKDVVNKAEKIFDVRREIIAIKTLCRAHLKAVLTPTQYSQVIGIYRSTLPKQKKTCKK